MAISQFISKKQAEIINDFYADSTYLIYTPSYPNLPYTPTGGGYFFAGEDYYVERDNLNMQLLITTVKGCGAFVYRDKSFSLMPGQAVLINGNEYHKYETAPNQGRWDFKWVRFSTEYFNLFDNIINQDSCFPISIVNTEFENLCDLFLQYLKSKEALKDLPMSNIVDSLLTILSEQTTYDPTFKYREKYANIERTREFISCNYNKNINIDELSKIANMNKSAFIRKFKTYVGMPPYAYILKERIHQAIIMLETSALSIQEISEIVGFASQNNFAKQFKAFMGISPTQYRIRV